MSIFIRPAEDSPEMRYMRQRIEAQGGPLPTRIVKPIEIKAPAPRNFQGCAGRLARPRGIDDIGLRGASSSRC